MRSKSETRSVGWLIDKLTRVKGYYGYRHAIVPLKNYSTIYRELKQDS